MTDFSKTLIRCSALGQIMTNPKGKTNLDKYNDALQELAVEQAKYDEMPNKSLKTAIKKLDKIASVKETIDELEKVKDDLQLSETCKSYLVQTYILEKYNRLKDISTKEMKKGTLVEDDSINLFSMYEGKLYDKNLDRISNEYIAGTPDLYDGDTLMESNEIVDIKSSWDIFTFLSNVQEPMNDTYYWQLQGYMALTEAKIGTIAYCLVNTPQSIVDGEKYSLLRSMDVISEEDINYKKEVAKLEKNRIFDDIPVEERILTISVNRNEDDIQNMYKKVLKCREFLADFERQHLNFSKNKRKF